MQTLPWIIVLVAMSVILPALTYFVLRARTAAPKPLPTEWALASRPVFNPDERRVHRLLREALPHHIILSKLPPDTVASQLEAVVEQHAAELDYHFKVQAHRVHEFFDVISGVTSKVSRDDETLKRR